MTKTKSNFLDTFVELGVPLAVVASGAAGLGAGIGNFSTIAAAVIASVFGAIFKFFFESALIGSEEKPFTAYLTLGGVYAVIAACSLLLVDRTIGF
jgi:hypothetical protein